MNIKRTSVLRRVPPAERLRYHPVRGAEGNVCAFELVNNSAITVEAVSGRSMIIVPGDVFLACPGYRESSRWVVGGIPDGGLVPGEDYWVISDSGLVGQLIGDSPREKPYLGQVRYLGTVRDEHGRDQNIRSFAVAETADQTDRGAPVYVLVGTSAEVGKTTAGLAIIQSLRQRGLSDLVVLKATGTASLAELSTYQDFGAAHVFDCVDFGLPSTFPSERPGIEREFRQALDTCLAIAADAVLIECGGDMLGTNVPGFLHCLKHRRPDPTVVLAAADALGALGGTRVLRDIDLPPRLITGPCTDTLTLQQRTEALCGARAVNMTGGGTDALA